MDNHVIVNVAQGSLRGRKVTLASGKAIVSFQGVPYAAPPVGPLRFKAPKPHLPWDGIRDALSEGNVCPQMNMLTNEYEGDEDCLFLNIFTPQIPISGSAHETSKAVMVFIHGGGFAYGSGNGDMYSPDFLLEQDVVVVTINYRLGALGFLSTEDSEIPGNAGLKDQVEALRWVKQNITQFGGNPNNVTIFGESAGGASVHYHILSPMSKGLFHRAIAQSGSALNSWAFSQVARIRTLRLAGVLGCKTDDSKQVLDFYMKVPAQELVKLQPYALSLEEKRRSTGLCLPFVPISEAMINGAEEKFLPESPITIIESGRFNMVPCIMGVTSNEGLLFLRDIHQKPDLMQEYDRDFERLLPEDLFPQIDSITSKEAAEKVKKFYFGDEPLCQKTLPCYSDLRSDALFVYMINKTVKLQARLSTAPMFYYQFAFDGSLGLYKHYLLNTNIPGVSHADDLGYLFKQTMFEMEIKSDSDEKKMLDMMVKMWTNFAKTGNPSATVSWHPVSPSRLNYLRIDVNPIMMAGLERKRIEFWDELYYTYNSSGKKSSKL